jgi:hypothetical protein
LQLIGVMFCSYLHLFRFMSPLSVDTCLHLSKAAVYLSAVIYRCCALFYNYCICIPKYATIHISVLYSCSIHLV